jgi:FixJ family two-component response regulator
VDKKNVVAVVDDHSGVREALGGLLASAGYGVKGFASAEDLLRLGMDGACCLILDIGLPGMDGFELHRQLAMQRCPPSIFITAHDDFDGHLRRAALTAGAIAFFRKPFECEQLLHAVGRACATAHRAA